MGIRPISRLPAETVRGGKTDPNVTTSKKLWWFATKTHGRNSSIRGRFATSIRHPMSRTTPRQKTFP